VEEGLLPAAEQTSGEKLVAVDGNLRPDLRTLDADRTSGTATTANDVRLGAAPRTMVVERSSGEEPVTSSMRVGQRPSIKAEPVTSCMLPAERPSGEVNAADIASDPDSVIGAHPPVDRSSTGSTRRIMC
jgi:hypothetical protein